MTYNYDFETPFSNTSNQIVGSIEFNPQITLLFIVVLSITLLCMFMGFQFGKHYTNRKFGKRQSQSAIDLHKSISDSLNLITRSPLTFESDALKKLIDEIESRTSSLIEIDSSYFVICSNLKKAIKAELFKREITEAKDAVVEVSSDHDRVSHALWVALHDFKREWSERKTLVLIEHAQRSLDLLINVAISYEKKKLPNYLMKCIENLIPFVNYDLQKKLKDIVANLYNDLNFSNDRFENYSLLENAKKLLNDITYSKLTANLADFEFYKKKAIGFIENELDGRGTDVGQNLKDQTKSKKGFWQNLWQWLSQPAFGKAKTGVKMAVPPPQVLDEVQPQVTASPAKKSELPKHKKSFLA